MAGSYLLRDEPCGTIGEYVAAGFGDGVRVARGLGRTGIAEALAGSGLRARDHTAVDLSVKWAEFARGGDDLGDRYLVVNATDAEPGSFSDRALIRSNPFAVVEGVVACAIATGVCEAFVALRGSFHAEYDVMVRALAEAELAGWLESVSVKCVRTPDAHLVGDDRALLECIEGRPPVPRRGPPELDGLFRDRPGGVDRSAGGAPPGSRRSNPTLVETPETLATVAAIVANGGRWFRSLGTALSPGSLLCTVTGDVVHPRVAEVELGTTLRTAVETVGEGFRGSPRGVLNGVSSPVMGRSRLAAPLSWEGLGQVGANVGRAAFVVLGDDADMVAVASQVSSYLHVESCALCPACKFGGGEVAAHLQRLAAGAGSARDVELMHRRLATIDDDARCGLALRHRDVVTSLLRAFPGDVLDPPERPRDGRVYVGDLVELDVLGARYDETRVFKRADWSYADTPVLLARR
ncbi:MAG: NADH-ubiquinone oxidoreductase-F iron-sulfur binding region domain-containing protein [Microthrixaceae bacterium]